MVEEAELFDLQRGSVSQIAGWPDGCVRVVGRDSSDELLLVHEPPVQSQCSVLLVDLLTNQVRQLCVLRDREVLSASANRDGSKVLLSVRLRAAAAKFAHSVVLVDCSSGCVQFLASHEQPVCCRLLRQSSLLEPLQEYFLQIRCTAPGHGTVELKKFSAAPAEEAASVSVALHQAIRKRVICCQFCPANSSLFLLHIDSFYGDVHQFTFSSLHCSASKLVYSVVCTFPIQLGMKAGQLESHFECSVPGSTQQQVLQFAWHCTQLRVSCALSRSCEHLVMLVDGSSGCVDWLFKLFVVLNRCVLSCGLSRPAPRGLRLRWFLCDGFAFVFVGNAALTVANANPGAPLMPVTLPLAGGCFGPRDELLDSQCDTRVRLLGDWRLVGSFPLSWQFLLRRLRCPQLRSDEAAKLMHLLVSLGQRDVSLPDRPPGSGCVHQLLQAAVSNPGLHLPLVLKQLLLSLVCARLRAQFPQLVYRYCLCCYASDLSAQRPATVAVSPQLQLAVSSGQLFADISFAERPQSELGQSCWSRVLHALAATRGSRSSVRLDTAWRQPWWQTEAAEELDGSFELLQAPEEPANYEDAQEFLLSLLATLEPSSEFEYAFRKHSMPDLQRRLEAAELVTFQKAIVRALAAECAALAKLLHLRAVGAADAMRCLQPLLLAIADVMPPPRPLLLFFTCLSFLAFSADYVLTRLLQAPGFYCVNEQSATFALVHVPDVPRACERLKEALLHALRPEQRLRCLQAAARLRRLPPRAASECAAADMLSPL